MLCFASPAKYRHQEVDIAIIEWILCVFFDLQCAPVGTGTRVGCQVLQRATDRFCGCLATVRIWVAELRGLRIRHLYTLWSGEYGYGTGLDGCQRESAMDIGV